MATLHQIPTQEQLWQILNDLERLKALEYSLNPDQQHNMQLLYEVRRNHDRMPGIAAAA